MSFVHLQKMTNRLHSRSLHDTTQTSREWRIPKSIDLITHPGTLAWELSISIRRSGWMMSAAFAWARSKYKLYLMCLLTSLFHWQGQRSRTTLPFSRLSRIDCGLGSCLGQQSPRLHLRWWNGIRRCLGRIKHWVPEGGDYGSVAGWRRPPWSCTPLHSSASINEYPLNLMDYYRGVVIAVTNKVICCRQESAKDHLR